MTLSLRREAASMIAAIWIGLILGVSFYATPIKFTAKGVSFEHLLLVGQVTFQTFTWIEFAAFVLLVVASIGRRDAPEHDRHRRVVPVVADTEVRHPAPSGRSPCADCCSATDDGGQPSFCLFGDGHCKDSRIVRVIAAGAHPVRLSDGSAAGGRRGASPPGCVRRPCASLRAAFRCMRRRGSRALTGGDSNACAATWPGRPWPQGA